MRDIERAWRMHLDEILYPQSESLEAPSLSDALERPDLDLRLGSPPEFGFDPSIRRPRTSPPDHRSTEREIEEIDDQGANSNGRDQPQREPRRRADPGQ
jgi:hypothetical protein